MSAIAFIGLGQMGAPMAKNLLKQGHRLQVFDVNPQAVQTLVESGAQAVGSLRMHDFGAPAVQVEYGSLFQIDAFARTWPLAQVAVGTRFAVQADQRSKPVVDRLMEEAYRWAQESRIQFCLLACEPFLHGVFEHYGFREYLPPAILPGGVDLLRMVLVLDDEPHLSECGSPLLHLVRDPVRAMPAKAWLTRSFNVAG